MINVVNKSKHKPTDNDVYIGRGSILGNPYHYKESNHPQALYKVASSDEAIDKYKKYLIEKINDRDVGICDFLNSILSKGIGSEDINLVCYCKPARCHGDVIKSLIESRINDFMWKEIENLYFEYGTN